MDEAETTTAETKNPPVPRRTRRPALVPALLPQNQAWVYCGLSRAVTKKPAADQSGLGDPAAPVKLFDTCIDEVIGAIRSIPAEALAGPPSFPGPFAANFAEGLLFGATHVAMHTGQLSTIRRSLGKPPAV